MRINAPPSILLSISGGGVLFSPALHRGQLASAARDSWEIIKHESQPDGGDLPPPDVLPPSQVIPPRDEAWVSAQGDECTPLSQKTDTGILSVCLDPMEYCVEDVSSSRGGRCMNGALLSLRNKRRFMRQQRSSQRLLSGGLFSDDENPKKKACTFKNGTEGTKCDGFDACYKLSDDQIAKISCGSCNKDGACSYWYEDNVDVTVDENSCVGFYACSYIGSNETDSTAVTLSIGKESCLGGRACSYVRHDCPEDSGMECSEPSYITIKDKSCNGTLSCAYIYAYVMTVGRESCQGTLTCSYPAHATFEVGNKSCKQTAACSWGSPEDGTAEVKIHDNSCDGCYSCYNNYGDMTVRDESCKGFYACSYNDSENIVIDHGCNGVGACSYIMGGRITVSKGGCAGTGACARIYDSIATIGSNSCNDVWACSEIKNASSLIVSDSSCTGFLACAQVQAESTITIGPNSCTLAYSCYQNSGTLTVGTSSCQGAGSCKKSEGTLTILDESCNECYSCETIKGEKNLIRSKSCNGGYSACSNSTDITIGENSCLNTQACKMATNLAVADDSCKGDLACKEAKDTEIGSNSCEGNLACQNSQAIIGQDSCKGYYSCRFFTGIIKDHSCRENLACSDDKEDDAEDEAEEQSVQFQASSIEKEIGNNSCNARRACRKVVADIGDCACNEKNECFKENQPVPSGTCTPSKSPTKMPDASSSHPSALRSPKSAKSKAGKGSKSSEVNKDVMFTDIIAIPASTSPKKDEADSAVVTSQKSPTKPKDSTGGSEKYDSKDNLTEDYAVPTKESSKKKLKKKLEHFKQDDKTASSSVTPPKASQDGVSTTDSTDSIAALALRAGNPSSTISPLSQTCYPNGKKVKLQSNNGEKIGVVAIEVYSYGIDVANGKSITMSQVGGNPWLEIELEELFSIERIDIRSPWCQSSTDSCLCHLEDSTLSISGNNESVWTKVLDGACTATSTLDYIVKPETNFCSSEAPSEFVQQRGDGPRFFKNGKRSLQKTCRAG